MRDAASGTGGPAAAATGVAIGDVPALVAGRRWGDTLPAWLFYAIAWAVGRVLHRRQRLVSTLTDRTVELEREREERARLAAIDERARIARELHDVIAHSVSVMALQASVERRVLAPEQQSTRDTLGSIEHTGRQALVELRRLLGIMRKADEGPTLAPQPSLDQLDALVQQVRQAGLPVELRIEGEPRAIARGVDVSAYRIVQEALTNVLKHAGPARAEVLVRYAASEVELVVCDDGHGSSEADGGGHGLAGIRERVALYDGDLQAGSRSGGGYELRARLPDAPAGR